MRYSLPQNIVRYSNGTLVKLTVSDHQFISYDYDPETDTGTYTPTSIKITAKYAGNLTYSKWQYTKDNSGWVDIPATNDLGITITSTTLTIVPSSSLFDKVNSFIMFRVVATDNDTGEEYTDTAEIERIVDYIILYRKQQTDIDQTADKIALIASDEQLRQYGTDNTVVSDLAALKVTAQGISSTVSSHTAALAKKANTSDVNAALANKADTTYVSENYSTKTQTAQKITQAVSSKANTSDVNAALANKANTSDVNTALARKADTTYVSENYSTKTQTAQKITQAVSSKANTSDVNAALANKANTSDVNTALARKADTTYVSENYSTKTQTAQKITQAVSSKVGEAEVRSLISQSADAIRLMARALSWTSDNSSLTEAGFLTITGGHVAEYEINQNALLCETINEVGTIEHVELTGSQLLMYQENSQQIPSVAPYFVGVRVNPTRIDFRTKTPNVIYGVTIDSFNHLSLYNNPESASDVWHITPAASLRAQNDGLTIIPWESECVHILGDLVVSRKKSRKVRTDNYQDRLLFCYETPTPLFGDIGEAVLDEEGLCYVDVDDIFSEAIAEQVEYQVFLQKEGEGDCWITDKQPRFFVIKGTPGLKISWELKAKQKGYETQRLEQFGAKLNEYVHVGEQESLLDLYIREQEELLYG